MKKNYILSLCCAMLMLVSYVDSFGQYEKGDIILNTGLGLGYWGYNSGYGGGFALGITANAEFSCILDDIAIGPYIAVSRRSYDYDGFDGSYNYTFVDFGARGTYHFGRLLKVNTDEFDPYAGVFLGFSNASASYDDGANGYNNYGNRVQGGVYAGARWYFSDKFGAFGEVGVGLYPILLGVTFKLK